jgi:uncharacterized membrane protein
MNYPRRQQYRRLSRAGGSAAGGAAALSLALVLASAGAISLAAMLLFAAVGFAFATRHWLGLAARSRVGARSEDDVRRQLAVLESEGWQMRHSAITRANVTIDAPADAVFAILSDVADWPSWQNSVSSVEADGTVGEGDLIGKTEAELRSLHFRRDRDWLQS